MDAGNMEMAGSGCHTEVGAEAEGWPFDTGRGGQQTRGENDGRGMAPCGAGPVRRRRRRACRPPAQGTGARSGVGTARAMPAHGVKRTHRQSVWAGGRDARGAARRWPGGGVTRTCGAPVCRDWRLPEGGSPVLLISKSPGVVSCCEHGTCSTDTRRTKPRGAGLWGKPLPLFGPQFP